MYKVGPINIFQQEQPIACLCNVVPTPVHPLEFEITRAQDNVVVLPQLTPLLCVGLPAHEGQYDLNIRRLKGAYKFQGIRPYPAHSVGGHQYSVWLGRDHDSTRDELTEPTV